ncbi:MAG TPA: glycosyltransferase family 2 protein [Vicinamibacterales bacterium]|nr:glycosyltransferase family 2 protein [Vicinamibacterales bacterium]
MSAARCYSLVVLTCNRPAALERCLRSIERLEWDGPPPEVIVVDDGSDPPSRSVVERFTSLRIEYRHQPNRGVAAARNTGLRAASGTYVAFIADDYVLPASYLRDVDEFFRAHGDARVITHNLAPKGAGVFSRVQRLYMQLALGQELRPGVHPSGVVSSFTLPASRAAVFARSVFDEVGAFDERLRVGEDGDFGRRLAAAGIPVHMFFWKAVEHHEALRGRDYLRQRTRYGRSYVRVLGGGPARASFETWGPAGIAVSTARKLREWWTVAGALGLRGRLLVHAPFITLFLAAFYRGAYQEYRDSETR